MNALHLAVNRNHILIVEMLLDSNYPLDLETADGMTAFQLAAYHGHSNIIEIMIGYLSKLDQADLTNTILNKVNPHSHLSTLAYSILNHHQTERDNFDISKMLIEFGARSYYGETDEQKDFSPIFMAV